MKIHIWVDNDNGDTLIKGKASSVLEAEGMIRGLVEKAEKIEAIKQENT